MNATSNVILKMKIAGIMAVVNNLTGENPVITDMGDYYQVSWTDAQREKIQGWIQDGVTPGSSPSGEIRFEILPLVLPPIVRVYSRYVIGAIVALFFLGRISK